MNKLSEANENCWSRGRSNDLFSVLGNGIELYPHRKPSEWLIAWPHWIGNSPTIKLFLNPIAMHSPRCGKMKTSRWVNLFHQFKWRIWNSAEPPKLRFRKLPISFWRACKYKSLFRLSQWARLSPRVRRWWHGDQDRYETDSLLRWPQ